MDLKSGLACHDLAFRWPGSDADATFVLKTVNVGFETGCVHLIIGSTGSGKSTTMDSIIDVNNQTVDAHAVIIGNPIEKIHQSKRCIVRHREVGRDVLSFKEGAIQALRQDPDIIVVGRSNIKIVFARSKIYKNSPSVVSAYFQVFPDFPECPKVFNQRSIDEIGCNIINRKGILVIGKYNITGRKLNTT